MTGTIPVAPPPIRSVSQLPPFRARRWEWSECHSRHARHASCLPVAAATPVPAPVAHGRADQSALTTAGQSAD